MLIRDAVAERVIGCAIAVHRAVGPGLLESAYHTCLACEFRATGLTFAHQVPVALVYRDTAIACAYRLDFVIEGHVVLEVKSVEHLLPVHKAQVITYLKLTGYPVGLLINFCVPVLRDGIRSVVLDLVPAPKAPNVDPV
jgi:GxxExxY protein